MNLFKEFVKIYIYKTLNDEYKREGRRSGQFMSTSTAAILFFLAETEKAVAAFGKH